MQNQFGTKDSLEAELAQTLVLTSKQQNREHAKMEMDILKTSGTRSAWSAPCTAEGSSGGGLGGVGGPEHGGNLEGSG